MQTYTYISLTFIQNLQQKVETIPACKIQYYVDMHNRESCQAEPPSSMQQIVLKWQVVAQILRDSQHKSAKHVSELRPLH